MPDVAPNLPVLVNCYVQLLQLPHDGTRARIQSALASLCAEIAHLTHRDPETVQNTFEEAVAISRFTAGNGHG